MSSENQFPTLVKASVNKPLRLSVMTLLILFFGSLFFTDGVTEYLSERSPMKLVFSQFIVVLLVPMTLWAVFKLITYNNKELIISAQTISWGTKARLNVINWPSIRSINMLMAPRHSRWQKNIYEFNTNHKNYLTSAPCLNSVDYQISNDELLSLIREMSQVHGFDIELIEA